MFSSVCTCVSRRIMGGRPQTRVYRIGGKKWISVVWWRQQEISCSHNRTWFIRAWHGEQGGKNQNKINVEMLRQLKEQTLFQNRIVSTCVFSAQSRLRNGDIFSQFCQQNDDHIWWQTALSHISPQWTQQCQRFVQKNVANKQQDLKKDKASTR